MITKEYAMAYREVIEILKYVSDEDVKKIPQEKLDLYKEYMDKEYDYKIDKTKGFEEQEMSGITEAIFANIFRDYWATPYQRERIIAKEKYDMERIEEEKRNIYNPDDIFKRKNTNSNFIEKVNLPVEVNESFLKKIVNFLKKILRI